MSPEKILSVDSLCVKLVTSWKNDTIVFTNGCFDILHPGHVFYLHVAASMGQKLVVALNSDESVRKLKGNSRPINNLEHRSIMLASLDSVNAVVSFDELDPMRLIKRLVDELYDRTPSLILVKGGDYEKSDIVGAKFVESHGGMVKTVPILEGYSTTNILNRMK